MAPELLRPQASDWWEDLESYLVEHFRRVKEGRDRQVDHLYSKWSENYDAIPAEKVRKVPFHKASNFVVPIIRIFVDTGVARTQGAIWSTNPLVAVSGFPNDAREGGESYLDRKARYEWGYYKLLNAVQMRGLKYGTAVTKIGWESRQTQYVTSLAGGIQSEPVDLFTGPWAKPIPFEDFFVYPIESDELEDAVVKYHLIRYPEEFARRMLSENDGKAGRPRWKLTTQELETALRMISEQKREKQQMEAGVEQVNYREFHAVECYLDWEIAGVHYPVIAFLQPDIGKLMDVYFDPIKPTGARTFVDYRPYQRDGLFYGDSMCRLLEQSQEEISRIHNERRDNNMIANGPQFKKKAGSRVPNPATNGYPGKVWEVDEMDDFDIVQMGRAINETITEEQNAFAIAERLIGLDGIMQGASQGSMQKRGVYNTGGTMAIMAQSNSRQMTHIRDFRWSVSEIAKSCFILQRRFGAEDPTIQMFEAPMVEKIGKFMEAATPDRLQRSFFEVKASDPSQNKEVDRQNLLQMAGTVSGYAQQTLQLAQQYQMAQGKNPLMEQILRKTLQMQYNTMVSLTRSFDQLQLEGELPNVARLIEEQQQQMASQQGVRAPASNGGGLRGPGGGGLGQIMAELQEMGPRLQ